MDIAAIRKALGLTQEQLGEKLGVTGTYVGHLEQDQRKPSLKIAAQLEELAGITGLVDEVVARKTGRAA